jgi:HD-GYP domain-containing protein (c-di-GMP phosphodiesterase class II)
MHIRRGALLHDLGMMGVSDAILQKPGELSDDEWRFVREHPLHAYRWLAPIEYLKPALDIPHYHHERWDGSGYPKGLKGEQIPLAARIFAVVDVWDSLQSERPYRKAWSREKTLTYLREQSGKHFDPNILDAFFKLQVERAYLSQSQ